MHKKTDLYTFFWCFKTGWNGFDKKDFLNIYFFA